MRTCSIASILAVATLFFISFSIHAQNLTRERAATAIPDLSGSWEPHRPVPVTAETVLCGIQSVCSALLGLAKRTTKFEEPEMQIGRAHV